jgi:hypothetical protein
MEMAIVCRLALPYAKHVDFENKIARKVIDISAVAV